LKKLAYSPTLVVKEVPEPERGASEHRSRSPRPIPKQIRYIIGLVARTYPVVDYYRKQ
jgi:hypothetical protein